MKYIRYRSVISLRKGQLQFAGRNSQGKITVRHRGGGHKQAFRTIDWTRNNVKAIVVGFEYDPQRNASLIKLYHSSINGVSNSASYSYALAPASIQLFQEVNVYNELNKKGSNIEIAKLLRPGDSAPISFYEPGDFIHAVEAFPNQGAIFGRSAGSSCQVMSISQQNRTYSSRDSKAANYAKVRLPSGNQRFINFGARATLGIVSSALSKTGNLKKAGRSRWLGWRPSVRGVAINPVDHPHGGGQGKTSGGRPSVTFKSWPTKGQPTRSPKRKNAFILKNPS